jgi:hypothetical protein
LLIASNFVESNNIASFSMARILARNFIAPIKHVRFLLLIARGKQDVLQVTAHLLSIGRLLAMSKKSCLVC